MGLKKYEIITVGSDKRVRALRSWQVQDRYVNIGDVGGIVYDEKTLSQDGACWLFRGNFNFPGARIGGDSIVDVGEAAPEATGSANLDILGTSTVVGAPVRFTTLTGAPDRLVFTASDFEQGSINYSTGAKWETWKAPSTQNIRLKAPVFMGGVSKTIKLDVPGYTVQAYVLDRDGVGLTATESTNTGESVTLTVPAGQYFTLRLAKNPAAEIVPADAAVAQIKVTATYETKLVVVDSRLEINPVTSSGITAIRPGSDYSLTPLSKYPDSVIQSSKVTINSHATTGRIVHLLTELLNVNATIDATTETARVVGIYHGVNNLAFTGTITANWSEAARSSIQAYDCDNMVVNPTNFPGMAEMLTAGVPIKFYNCNLNNGRFYHHAQIANTYRDINFDLATKDLGKTFSTDRTLSSSEVNGMYRAIFNGAPGPLIESYESVKDMGVVQNQKMYNTTIYADAYFSGLFDIEGTNVFGNKVRSHPLAQVLKVQPRAVQGMFNTVTPGAPITGVVANANRVCVPVPFRVNGSKGLTINCPAGVEGAIICTDINGVIKGLTVLATGESSVPAAQLVNTNAYLFFSKAGATAITPADLAGVTVTVYNGCKIVNTGVTAVPMKGNIRVEDNATLVNASITGTGYFGGNAVASGLRIGGAAFMSDNASFVKKGGAANIRNLKMTDNAKAVIGDVVITGSVHIKDNAVFTPTNLYVAEADFYLQDNAKVTADVSVNGSLLLKDNAAVNRTLTVVGCITLCGSYNQTAAKTWTGKRVIDNENAPEYDNNVKTQYDF